MRPHQRAQHGQRRPAGGKALRNYQVGAALGTAVSTTVVDQDALLSEDVAAPGSMPSRAGVLRAGLDAI